jgi:hypothetical protein
LFLFEPFSFFKQINSLLETGFDVITDRGGMVRRSQSTPRSIASELSDCFVNRKLLYHAGNFTKI